MNDEPHWRDAAFSAIIVAIIEGVVIALMLVGCTYSAPSFRDVSRSWDADGNLIEERIIKGRQPTVAAPFSSRAFSTQRLDLRQIGENWEIGMGSHADIQGGDVSPSIEAGARLVAPLVDPLHGVFP